MPVPLLVLCALLLVWAPISFGLVASNALAALPVVGWPLAALVLARVLVTGLGIAAGLALLKRRPGALALAKISLTVSAIVELVFDASPHVPSNRAPGETPIYVAVSLTYYGVWLAYLFGSKRVRGLN